MKIQREICQKILWDHNLNKFTFFLFKIKNQSMSTNFQQISIEKPKVPEEETLWFQLEFNLKGNRFKNFRKIIPKFIINKLYEVEISNEKKKWLKRDLTILHIAIFLQCDIKIIPYLLYIGYDPYIKVISIFITSGFKI